MATDARIPVVLGSRADLGPGDLLLTMADQRAEISASGHLVLAAAPPHPIGCGCCGGRDPWAEALTGRFVAMVKGDLPRCDRVVAVLDAAAAARLMNLVTADRMLAARYRAG